MSGKPQSGLQAISTACTDLRDLAAATDIGTLLVDRDLRIRVFTPPITRILPITEQDVGRAITEFSHHLEGWQARQDLHRALREGAVVQREVRGRHGRRHLLRIRPCPDKAATQGAVLTFADIGGGRHGDPALAETLARDRAAADERHDRLTREFGHRLKNMLAGVQALARQPDTPEMTVEDYRTALIGRIQALAEAHDALSETGWRSADLHTLVGKILSADLPAEGPTVAIAGPPVDLTPKQTRALALIVHELATNAVAHGAVSARGALHVAWTIGPSPKGEIVSLLWTETGGPPVGGPVAQGLGTRLIERACSYELGGTVDWTVRRDGLRVKIVFPAADV